jgi:hypothetical protein
MQSWMSDGRVLLAASVLMVVVSLGWVFRYETYNVHHRNRFTGATCFVHQECW